MYKKKQSIEREKNHNSNKKLLYRYINTISTTYHPFVTFAIIMSFLIFLNKEQIYSFIQSSLFYIKNIFYTEQNNKIANEEAIYSLDQKINIMQMEHEISNLKQILNYKNNLKSSNINQFHSTVTKIYNISINSKGHQIFLPLGTDDNLTIGNAVIINGYFAGRITKIYPNYSIANLITSHHVKVIGKIPSLDKSFIIEGQNNSHNKATIKYLDFDNLEKIQNDEDVFTSGELMDTPEGIKVGTIKKNQNNEITLELSFNTKSMNFAVIYSPINKNIFNNQESK